MEEGTFESGYKGGGWDLSGQTRDGRSGGVRDACHNKRPVGRSGPCWDYDERFSKLFPDIAPVRAALF